jgi:hypothetical protein
MVVHTTPRARATAGTRMASARDGGPGGRTPRMSSTTIRARWLSGAHGDPSATGPASGSNSAAAAVSSAVPIPGRNAAMSPAPIPTASDPATAVRHDTRRVPGILRLLNGFSDAVRARHRPTKGSPVHALRRLAATPAPTSLAAWRWELRAGFLLVGGLVGMALGV